MADASQIPPTGTGEAAADMGEMLVRMGIISSDQAREIDAAHGEGGQSYAEVAVALGLISSQDLSQLIAARRAQTGTLDHSRFHRDIVVAHQPRSHQAEDFRALRNALSLRWFKHPEGARSLAVISANRHEGRSVCAANLAVSFAQIGLRTLLVDADMRSPRQHELFGVNGSLGLASYLKGAGATTNYPNIGDPDSLSVLPVGEAPSDPQELLLGAPLHDLIAAAQKNCDVILFDTPAASDSSDYQTIAAACGGALVITRAGESRVRPTARLINDCEDLGIKVVGATMMSD
jgi:chain length determinant protein tyrosine kinase EpsG